MAEKKKKGEDAEKDVEETESEASSAAEESAAEPEQPKGNIPWSGVAIVGVLVALIAWGLLRGDPNPATSAADAGAAAKGNASPGSGRADDDPLMGNWFLEQATKNIKGTGALHATIDTSMGALTCRLFDDKAPVTVANFIGLATGERTWKDQSGKWVNKPAYDGTTFHRIIQGFMIQGGDSAGNGTGQPGYVIKDEIWEGAKHDRIGLLCMANRGHNTNGAQFFITEEKNTSLDGNYTIFGECTPHDLIREIAKVPTESNDQPKTPVVIKSVRIARK